MKKIMLAFLAVILTLLAAACVDNSIPPDKAKIAIITLYAPQYDTLLNVQPVIDKYGESKVIHVYWPERFMEEQNKVSELVEELGQDMAIQAIVVSDPIPGVNAAFAKLRESRKDIFVVYCGETDTFYDTGDTGLTQTDTVDLAQTANLILATDRLGTGSAMVRQAQHMGATTFAYFCASRLKYDLQTAERRTLIKAACEELGLAFVDIGQEFICDGGPSEWEIMAGVIPKMVEQYGKETAFFGAGAELSGPILNAVIESGAIYPHNESISPFWGFDRALLDVYVSDDGWGINPETNEKSYVGASMEDVLSSISAAAAEQGMTGRLATWPVNDYYMRTIAGADYAFMRINGEVSAERIDAVALKRLMEDYAGVEVYLTPYYQEHYLLVKMDCITF